MRLLLKILISGLLLLAIGVEVVALHCSSLPDPALAIPAVVVRKATRAYTPPKSVLPVLATEERLAGRQPHETPEGQSRYVLAWFAGGE